MPFPYFTKGTPGPSYGTISAIPGGCHIVMDEEASSYVIMFRFSPNRIDWRIGFLGKHGNQIRAWEDRFDDSFEGGSSKERLQETLSDVVNWISQNKLTSESEGALKKIIAESLGIALY